MSTYHIQVDDQTIVSNVDDLAALDIHQRSLTDFHILKNQMSFDVQVLHANMSERTMTISVNGNPYTVSIKDAYDAMVSKMGLLEVRTSQSNDIKVPMPGYIIDIMVNVGDTIKEGTPLFVLSAMKMENTILSDGTGVIKAIKVKKEAPVTKGQLIIEMED